MEPCQAPRCPACPFPRCRTALCRPFRPGAPRPALLFSPSAFRRRHRGAVRSAPSAATPSTTASAAGSAYRGAERPADGEGERCDHAGGTGRRGETIFASALKQAARAALWAALALTALSRQNHRANSGRQKPFGSARGGWLPPSEIPVFAVQLPACPLGANRAFPITGLHSPVATGGSSEPSSESCFPVVRPVRREERFVTQLGELGLLGKAAAGLAVASVGSPAQLRMDVTAAPFR